MAMASNSSSAPIQAQNSPRSRQSRRYSAARGIPSTAESSPPHSLSGIVDQEQFAAFSDSFASSSLAEDGSTVDPQLENSDNGGAAKKPAWNKPSNGATAEVSAVMGADSWPALSESARASPKSSSSQSLKSLSHGSITASQEMAEGSASQEMSVSSLSSPKEANTTISTPNSSSSNVAPTRQRSMKRGGGSSNGSLSQAPPMQGAVVEAPSPNPGKSSGSVGESSRDNTRDAGQRGGSHNGNEQQPQRSSFRRNNSGLQSRGDGSYHHNHGGRRDQDRGKQDWGNPHRRESHASQQRVGSRPFLHGPSPNAPFAHPLAPPVGVRPFATPMVYTEMPSHLYYVPGLHPDSFRPMHMVPIPPAFFPMPDPHLPTKIMNQIDYYFSNENLVKDTFLRRNMDSEGWVSIKLISGFKKVVQLTDNIQLILHAIQGSNVVEIQGDKVRRRNDWIKWIMPPITSPQSSQNMVAAHLKSITLDEKAAT